MHSTYKNKLCYLIRLYIRYELLKTYRNKAGLINSMYNDHIWYLKNFFFFKFSYCPTSFTLNFTLKNMKNAFMNKKCMHTLIVY